jgi:hypothetical protein
MIVDGENFIPGFESFFFFIAAGNNASDETVVADHLHAETVLVSGGARGRVESGVRVVQTIQQCGDSGDGAIQRFGGINIVFGFPNLRIPIDAMQLTVVIVFLISAATFFSISWANS